MSEAARVPDDLFETLGHRFAHPELLIEALTHASAVPRHTGRGRPKQGYERLEFLGDRVLGLVVADLLWRRFEDEPEGDLTRRHADLVRRETLAAIAAELGFDQLVRVSPAEAASGGMRRPAILADVLEAVIAAIYLDAEKSKLAPGLVAEVIADKSRLRFSLAPEQSERIADFLLRTGSIKTRATSWRDFFFPEIHGEKGS